MRFKSVLLLSAALLLLAASCKKKEEETTYLSFEGTPEFTVPHFVRVGQTFTLTPREVKRAASDTKTELPGCYWTVSQLALRDTLRREGGPSSASTSFTFEVPDSLRAITVMCAMFGEGYSNANCSRSCIVVRTRGGYSSLQGIDYPKHTFRDARDGRIYHYQTVGKYDWMTQNLAYDGYGYSYYDCEVMDDLFGRYYSWNDAVKACPEGWRLPSNEEFLAFHNTFAKTHADKALDTFQSGAGVHMANAYFNNSKMWEYWPDVNPENTSAFALLPLGYLAIRGDEHAHLEPMKYALFWTADEYGEEQAFYRSIYMKYDRIYCEPGYKDYMALNVRCIRKND